MLGSGVSSFEVSINATYIRMYLIWMLPNMVARASYRIFGWGGGGGGSILCISEAQSLGISPPPPAKFELSGALLSHELVSL